MRIGFLYNHDALHQVPHTISIASSLARRGVDVLILTSSEEQRALAASLLAPDVDVDFIALRIGVASRAADRLLRTVAPFRRLAVLRGNLDTFARFDALVVPETTSAFLKTRFGLDPPKLIYQPHGAGDGEAGFQPVTRHFDFVLLSGTKLRDRMLAEGLITRDTSAIVGYPKFDVAGGMQARPFFDNGRPTVLYNPHFNPLLSSWYTIGPAILRWFAAQDRYNLIFAPHVMLFKRTLHTSIIHRSMRVRPPVPPQAVASPTVLIDTGSRHSIDMSYTNAADIYLGDVSSQIYEWILRPRPVIVFDTHRPDWRNDASYRHWRLGEVIETVAALPDALARAASGPTPFLPEQKAAALETFSALPLGAGERAAEAILGFLARSA